MTLAILTVAVIFDLRTRQIPDTLSVCLLVLALAATGFHLHRTGWMDLGLGLTLGLGLGTVLFWLGAFGGGDVKLLAALGAILGFKDEMEVMFYTALWGAAIAALASLWKQREIPYVPAIAMGVLVFIIREYFGREHFR
jgi:prepilin peptidase CpaA